MTRKRKSDSQASVQDDENGGLAAPWASKLAQCFSAEEHRFADGVQERQHAFELLVALRSHGATWSDVKEVLETYLSLQDTDTKHALKQIERARKRLRPWLRRTGE